MSPALRSVVLFRRAATQLVEIPRSQTRTSTTSHGRYLVRQRHARTLRHGGRLHHSQRIETDSMGNAASFRGRIGISSSNDMPDPWEPVLGMNVLAGVGFIFTTSTTPPQPNARGVDVHGNTAIRRTEVSSRDALSLASPAAPIPVRHTRHASRLNLRGRLQRIDSDEARDRVPPRAGPSPAGLAARSPRFGRITRAHAVGCARTRSERLRRSGGPAGLAR
jgi:hypothetical protein